MTTRETFSLLWITDRPPTQKDASLDGNVMIIDNISIGPGGVLLRWHREVNWTSVKTGTTWRPLSPSDREEVRQ